MKKIEIKIPKLFISKFFFLIQPKGIEKIVLIMQLLKVFVILWFLQNWNQVTEINIELLKFVWFYKNIKNIL